MLGISRNARTIGLALAGGLVAFEAVLALGVGAVGIPGVFLVRVTGAEAEPGGESVIAKPWKVESASQSARDEITSPQPPPAVTDTPELTDIVVLAPPPDFTKPLLDAEPDKKPLGQPESTPAGAATARGIARPGEREELPWHLTEPVRLSAVIASRPLAAAATVGRAPVQLPPQGNVEGWVKTKASARAGGFELWVEPPAALKQRLIAVAYDSGGKSVEPRSQESREQNTGFRVRFAGAACAGQITLTLKYDDGQTQKVIVDGCKLSG